MQSFFDALPNETNMAYVVITHLHPEYESHLPEILQSHTEHASYAGDKAGESGT